jgi:hypothetical protein
MEIDADKSAMRKNPLASDAAATKAGSLDEVFAHALDIAYTIMRQ